MIKRILWQSTGGYYLFWTTFVYFWVAMYNLFVDQFCATELIQVVWIVAISLPLWIRPLARRLNVKCVWELG